MKKHFLILFLIIFSFSNSFGQSKKEQIEELNYRVDSLVRILGSERSSIKQQKASLEQQIVDLNNSITKLKAQALIDKNSLKTKDEAIVKAASENAQLSTALKEKNDSLNLVLADLVKLKPPVKVVPVIPVVDNKGPIKGVAIGSQVWMSTNLNVSTYRNGDVIPQVQDKDTWDKLTTGAWCYYENNAANGTKYGKLYNWYAVNDARGLAPAGWHIPTDQEWTVLENSLGDDAGKKMKSTSGWESWTEDITCSNCKTWNTEYRRKKECNVCQDTRVNGKKTYSGNGMNSSGFSGLPGGYRYFNGYFFSVGNNGYWWSASENNESDAWYRLLYYDDSNLSRFNYAKKYGISVRCVRD
jgi:uncharacterized protein (TIGR02145 family)